MTGAPPSLFELSEGLDLRNAKDRTVFRRRLRTVLYRLRVAELHAEADRLSGMLFSRQAKARNVVIDAWLEQAVDLQHWTQERP